jgi:UPF0176 protein
MITVAALYRFARFDDPQALCTGLREVCEAAGVRGTLLLATEGINGTIAGPRDGLDRALAAIRALPGCADVEVKKSTALKMPFAQLKVRVKREIVTMGQPGVAPDRSVGRYVAPAAWNALIASDDVVTIDTRNDYEVAIGSFAGAVDPGTASFSEFPDWWGKNADRLAGKRIAMFCTGGIRCEKATSWLVSQGVADVFHLQGGILKYLEEVPPEDSLWQGECFVFDQRVSVGHGLVPGNLRTCGACRRPLDAVATGDLFEPGVSCSRCHAEHSDADRARFRERQRQLDLAARRGTVHRHGDG